MLDVHRLRVFRSVVASGSVHAAAANLGYTASAVSQHIAALQRETGLALFTRAGRGIEPTPAGLALAEEIDGVLSRLGRVEGVVADLRAGRTGSLSIGYFASVGSAWMPHVGRALTREFPGIRLNLSLREDLAVPGERPDIQLIVERDGFTSAAGTTAQHLLDDPYVVVMPKSHPLAGSAVVELTQIANDRWIDNDAALGWCRRNLLEACRAAGFEPSFHVEVHDYPTAIAFVDVGLGVTVLPRLGARNLPAGVVAAALTGPTPRRSIYALVATSVENIPPVRAALDILHECASRDTHPPSPARASTGAAGGR
jgi:DNA-binding transcriptional LysR family regulator